jgi:hypothetical protein
VTARGLLRSSAALAAGVSFAALIAGAAFALETTLRPPSSSEEIAVRALARLDRLHSMRAVLEFAGLPGLPVTCRRLGQREVVDLGPAGRILVFATHVRQLSGPFQQSPAVVAEADLAGCPHLLSDELVTRLQTSNLILREARWRGRPAYRLQVSRGRPTVWLYLSTRELRPVGLRFMSSSIVGESVLRSR